MLILIIIIIIIIITTIIMMMMVVVIDIYINNDYLYRDLKDLKDDQGLLIRDFQKGLERYY